MTVMERIDKEYSGMSRAQQKIVHYLQENMRDLLLDSLAVFSKKAGSSEATVVRFAYHLGYSGYTDLQKCLRSEMMDKSEAAEPAVKAEAGPFAACTEDACRRLEQTMAKLDVTTLEHACAALMEAENVLVIGYLHSLGMGAQLFNMLDDMRPFVDFCRLLPDAYEINRRMHKNAAVMVVSFAPHYRYSYDLIRRASERQCKVVLMTDSRLNPLTKYADHLLVVDTLHDREAGCVDVTPAQHLAHMMIRHITSTYPDKVAEHQRTALKRFEEYLE